MKQDQTILQVIEFGKKSEDCYYCLVDKSISPNGMSVESLKLSDPRNFDMNFKESGCLLLFTRCEIEEMIQRGDLDEEDLHKGIYHLAQKEGLFKKKM
jgi:hypothetical protein